MDRKVLKGPTEATSLLSSSFFDRLIEGNFGMDDLKLIGFLA